MGVPEGATKPISRDAAGVDQVARASISRKVHSPRELMNDIAWDRSLGFARLRYPSFVTSGR